MPRFAGHPERQTKTMAAHVARNLPTARRAVINSGIRILGVETGQATVQDVIMPGLRHLAGTKTIQHAHSKIYHPYPFVDHFLRPLNPGPTFAHPTAV